MPESDDFIDFITPTPSNFGYRQGIVTAWDMVSGRNQIRVGGSDLVNLPVITQSDLISLRVGDAVAVIKYNDSFAVLGKIKSAANTGKPWAAVPLYKMFEGLLTEGNTGYTSVNVGTLAAWEGRINLTHHSFVQVDGVWGTASGTNTVVYEVQLGGAMVGTWTTTGLEVTRKGPFDIARFRDQEFLKIEVRITSSTGTGTVAHQVLACYLR